MDGISWVGSLIYELPANLRRCRVESGLHVNGSF